MRVDAKTARTFEPYLVGVAMLLLTAIGLAVAASGARADPRADDLADDRADDRADYRACAPLLDHEKRHLNSERSVRLCDAYRGQVLLLVNTASKCAYTPQYDGLEALHAKLAGRGFQVLGFPSNDFGGQEPGTEAQVQEFCRLTYSVKFPMFEKSRVRRDNAEPLYRALGAEAGEYPRWNFHKYLLDRDGRLVASFPSGVRPDAPALVDAIEKLL